MNRLPINVEICFRLFRNILNWFAGWFIVLARSPQATLDWFIIVMTRKYSFSACVISDIFFLIPRLKAVSPSVATLKSIPYFLTAVEAPAKPLDKLAITRSKGTFASDDKSPANMVKPFEAAMELSCNIPTELVICMIRLSKFNTSVTSSPRFFIFALVNNSPFSPIWKPDIFVVNSVSLSLKLSAYSFALA